jgi:hypothetical protein
MFEQLDDQEPKLRRRRRLPFWAILTIWLVMAIGFAAYNWFLVRQDEAIAPREQVVLGSVYKISHGKTDTAFYTFNFAGRAWHGSEMAPYKQCVCDAAVYFDPTNPSNSSLVEYRRKSRLDHRMMTGCGYASAGLGAALACVLVLKKARRKSQADYSRVS